jgi:D-glycero-alpha-D-manno-heptose 1-phosphate guanylyltransferase
MKAIVLCGGLGTRLGLLTKDMPKPLLMVAGKPFIAHVLDRLTQAGISGFVLAAGFHWAKLRDFIGENWNGVPVQYSVESEALGTGGAIKNALGSLDIQDSLIVNGDTLFDIDIPKFIHFAIGTQALACIALRKVEDCARYGRVTVDTTSRIMSFGEKGHQGAGLINGGVYFLRSTALDSIPLTTFSFESAFLQDKHSSEPIFGMPFDDYFIDIGIPADFHRAQTELMALNK